MAEFVRRECPAELLRELNAARKTSHGVRDGDLPPIAAGQPDDPGDVRPGQAGAVLGEPRKAFVGEVAAKIVAKDSDTCMGVLERQLDMVFQPAGPKYCRIGDRPVVAGAGDHHAFPVDHPVEAFQGRSR
ncbi:hypothetical protein [Rhizobium dioscoreae]|nr:MULTISPECIES: hypothetical protein [Rhizobium]